MYACVYGLLGMICGEPIYHHVASLPNVNGHNTVNHSIEFVDSVTGAHTQNIESNWNLKIRGCHEDQLASYLDEYMYRKRYV